MEIRKAVVPAAGLGTRMRPLTLACPKELLPLGDRPVLHHVADEVIAAGLQEVCFVISPAKDAIRGYFAAQGLPLRVEFAVQEKPLGLGHALLPARDFVGDEPFAIVLGDTVIESAEPCQPLARMAERYRRTGRPSILVQRLPPEKVVRYGVVKPKRAVGEEFPIVDLVEKPRVEEAPSEYAVTARYLVPALVMDYLQRTPPAPNGEIQLSDALAAYLRDGHECDALSLRPGERRHDIGSLESYYLAFGVYAQRALDAS